MIMFTTVFYSCTFLIPDSLPSFLFFFFFPFSLMNEILFLWVISRFTSRFPFELQILNHHLPYLLRFSDLILHSFMVKKIGSIVPLCNIHAECYHRKCAGVPPFWILWPVCFLIICFCQCNGILKCYLNYICLVIA